MGRSHTRPETGQSRRGEIRRPLVGLSHHAVNSQAALQAFLDSPALIAEGDVLVGRHAIAGPGTAIMAHPPHTESDLSFAEWVDAIGVAGRAIKVDIKDAAAVGLVEAILLSQRFPEDHLILNADVCVVPGEVPARLPVEDLMHLRAAFPDATLSVGSTTRPDAGPYRPRHIAALREASRQIGGAITVALRVSLVREDPTVLRALPDLHLSFWNGPDAPADAATVTWLRTRRPDALLDLRDALGNPVQTEPEARDQTLGGPPC